MKKRLSIIILLLCTVLAISLTGCEQTEPEPEPYTKMIECVNKEDLAHAREYANLVIQDFPESDYVYNAYLIKSMILCSKLQLQYAKGNFLEGSVDNLNTYLLEQSDIDALENYLETTINKIDKLNKSFNKTLKYLLEHYEDADKIKLTFPEQSEGEVFYAERDMQSLSFFSTVGYPIPSESDMYSNDTENTVKIFRQVVNGTNGDEPFSYLRYFYITSTVCIDEALLENICNQIIKMTEDDKYNEYRLEAEKYLKENK